MSEVPDKLFNAIMALFIIAVVTFIATADNLLDFYPGWVEPMLLASTFIMLMTISAPKAIKRSRTHLDQERIFRGIDGTSNVIEDIVISRIQKDVLFVMANGASNMSLQRDLERIQFIVKTRSMRKVEDFIEKLIIALAIKFYEG